MLHLPRQSSTLVSGSMAGNTTRLPLLNTTGRQKKLPGSSAVMCGAPTSPENTLQPVFRTVVLERLRLPLDIIEARCLCGGFFDSLRRHRGACPRSGRSRSRAFATERTLARTCREAGATVRVNVKLRDMNVAVSALDEREVEMLASGLGRVCPNAARVDSVVADAARRDKELNCSVLVDDQRCHLVVVALETGRRWSSEAHNFIESLAWARSRRITCCRGQHSWPGRRRWTRMLSISCCRAFAGSPTSPCRDLSGVDGVAPDLADILQVV